MKMRYLAVLVLGLVFGSIGCQTPCDESCRQPCWDDLDDCQDAYESEMEACRSACGGDNSCFEDECRPAANLADMECNNDFNDCARDCGCSI